VLFQRYAPKNIESNKHTLHPKDEKQKIYKFIYFSNYTSHLFFFWPILVIEDKAKQALAKMALKTEWEAYFEPNSYGFKLGRSCQYVAIKAIFLAIWAKPEYVLNVDISKCFNCINHEALLNKLKTLPSLTK